MWNGIKSFLMTPVYIWRSLKMKSPQTAQMWKIVAGSIMLIIVVTIILIVMSNVG